MSSVLPFGQGDPLLAAARGHQERHAQTVGDRHAAHVEAPAAMATSSAEHLGEDAAHIDKRFVSAGPLVLAAEAAGTGLVAIKAAWRHVLPGSVDFARVEATPLLGVRKQVVGLADLLEPGLRGLVAGIEIGMVLFGERAEGLSDVVIRSSPRNAQY